VFDLFLTKRCHGWPGPGVATDHIYTMNPAREFINSHDAHVKWGNLSPSDDDKNKFQGNI
jgi:hypothetical protein